MYSNDSVETSVKIICEIFAVCRDELDFAVKMKQSFRASDFDSSVIWEILGGDRIKQVKTVEDYLKEFSTCDDDHRKIYGAFARMASFDDRN